MDGHDLKRRRTSNSYIPIQGNEILKLQSENKRLKEENEKKKKSIASLKKLVIKLSQNHKLGPIHDLPEEMIFSITQYLPQSSVITLSRVCKQWRANISQWLRTLDLSPYSQRITDETLAGLQNYPNIQHLNVNRCVEVSEDKIVEFSTSFLKLTELELYGCTAPSSLNPFSNLTNLTKLRIGGSSFDNVKCSDLLDLPVSLEYLDLDWCQGIEECFLGLMKLTKMHTFKISQCDSLKSPSYEVPTPLIPVLRNITIRRQQLFNDLSLESLSEFTNLEKLKLHWVGIAGTGFGNFGNQQKHSLRELTLLRCYALNDMGMHVITSNLSGLRKLSIRGSSRVSNTGLNCIKKLRELKKLRLSLTSVVTDAGFQFLDSISLTSINIRNCGVFLNEAMTTAVVTRIVDTQCDLLSCIFHGAQFLVFDTAYNFLRLKELKNLQFENCNRFVNGCTIEYLRSRET